MPTLYFCLQGSEAVLRQWSAIPRIGDTVALPELGGNLNPLRVFDVVWDGTIEPEVTVYVRQIPAEHAIYYDQASASLGSCIGM
jgi:hypothetical protein